MRKNQDWSTFQRQPASAIWLLLIKSFGKIIKTLFPLILVMLFSTRKDSNATWDYLLIIVPVMILVVSLVDYFYFKFSVSNDQLLVAKGLLAKKNIVLPFNKIQAVHIEQNWLHQMLDLAQVSFDSPGAAEAEVKINLEKDQAESLKALIIGLHTATVTEETPTEKVNIAKLSFSDLVKLGISANHLETLVIMLGLGLWLFTNIKEILEDRFNDIYQQSTSDLVNSGTAFIIYTTVGILLLSVIVSFIRIYFKYANFSVNKTENGFSIQGGLLNTTEKVVPFKKIQFLSWKSSLLGKRIPIYILEYHSIGSPQSNQKLKVKIPVTTRTLLDRLTEIYHEVNKDEDLLLKISKGYVYRTTLIRGIIPFILLSAIAAIFVGFNTLLLVSIPIYVLISSWLFFRKFRFNYNSEILHIRKGIFGNSEIIVKWNNIQSVSVGQSHYQRRKNLATISLYTAGGTLSIPFIALDQARAIQNYALYKIESSIIPWM